MVADWKKTKHQIHCLEKNLVSIRKFSDFFWGSTADMRNHVIREVPRKLFLERHQGLDVYSKENAFPCSGRWHGVNGDNGDNVNRVACGNCPFHTACVSSASLPPLSQVRVLTGSLEMI